MLLPLIKHHPHAFELSIKPSDAAVCTQQTFLNKHGLKTNTVALISVCLNVVAC